MKKEFGLVGLGVMGKSLALNMLDKGVKLSVYNRTVPGTEEGVAKDFVAGNPGAEGFDDLRSFAESLESPRKILIMINAGEAVDDLVQSLMPFLSEGDVLLDGGNSHYLDTRKRSGYLSVKGILYLGVGISGGEEGARKGASIMPGGSTEGYQLVEKYLTAIAAKDKSGEACCTYVGPDGSGHFTKMVHNGIEYAEMQIIAEVYDILRNLLGLSPEEISEHLQEWSSTGYGSYLLEITTDILKKKEDGILLLDKVLDAAEQKGTGGWSVKAALELGVPVNTISEAVSARIISSLKHLRAQADQQYQLSPQPGKSVALTIEQVKKACMAARIINHATGFHLLQEASEQNGWNLQLDEVARIWTNGCIIRSELMETLVEYLKKDGHLLSHPSVTDQLKALRKDLASVVSNGLQNNIALPVLSASVNYFLSFVRADSPANLIQAQRDYFGAHTYKRKDGAENECHHSNWTS